MRLQHFSWHRIGGHPMLNEWLSDSPQTGVCRCLKTLEGFSACSQFNFSFQFKQYCITLAVLLRGFNLPTPGVQTTIPFFSNGSFIKGESVVWRKGGVFVTEWAMNQTWVPVIPEGTSASLLASWFPHAHYWHKQVRWPHILAQKALNSAD